MKKYFFSLLISLVFFACDKDDGMPPPPPPPPSPAAQVLPNIPLTGIDALLNSDNDTIVDILNKVRGSVGNNNNGSFAIWSTDNDYNLAVVLSANHVFGSNWWGDVNTAISETLRKPAQAEGVARVNLLPVDGALSFTHISPIFSIYTPEIPQEENTNGLLNILPAHDFNVNLIDNQKGDIEDLLPPQFTNVQTNQATAIYDPNQRTTANPNWAAVSADEVVLAIGYPNDTATYPLGAASAGKVLSDAAAIDLIQALKDAGDEEGDIAYDSAVEMIVETAAQPGMSGGGVFNHKGQLVGVLVRGTSLNDKHIIRAVRLTHIKQRITNAYNNLSATDKADYTPFLGDILD